MLKHMNLLTKHVISFMRFPWPPSCMCEGGAWSPYSNCLAMRWNSRRGTLVFGTLQGKRKSGKFGPVNTYGVFSQLQNGTPFPGRCLSKQAPVFEIFCLTQQAVPWSLAMTQQHYNKLTKAQTEWLHLYPTTKCVIRTGKSRATF